ncbi:MAG TPA: hypothetical protein VFZ27_14025 [Terriglobia bacterium]|nr:hypothetical protein [Terriglobia bacterium]
MHGAKHPIGSPGWLMLIGGSMFIVVLAVSAYWQSDIRWLHFFQAWMYIATIVLGLRGNRLGYFIGISAAGLWDYVNLFVTTFFANGLEQLYQWAHTGHLARPDVLIAVPAWFSNLLVIVGCLWGYCLLPTKRRGDTIIFPITFVLTTVYFAIIMALFQPRYLAIFPRLLHPSVP